VRRYAKHYVIMQFQALPCYAGCSKGLLLPVDLPLLDLNS